MTERPETVTRAIRVRARLPGRIEEVFAFISDPRNDPKWVDTTPRVTQTKGKTPKVGALYTFHQTVGRPVDGTIEITEMDPPRFMAFRVQDPMREYRVTYHLRTRGAGVHLTQTSYPKLFIHLGWKRWFIGMFTRKQLRKQMRMLREALQ